MASNVRAYRQGEVVVDPVHLAEFDRMTRSSPTAVTFTGTVLFVIACWAGLAQPLGAGTVFAVLFGTAALAVTAFGGVKLALARSARVAAISRNLSSLRQAVVFDEAAVTDLALWEASALAEDLWELVERHERLEDALVRTASQERELEAYLTERERLGRVLLGMLHPAVV